MPTWRSESKRLASRTPNSVEFFGSVGSDLWMSNVMWSADKRPKYGTPEKRLDQMLAFVQYF